MAAYQGLARYLLGSNRLDEGIATYEAGGAEAARARRRCASRSATLYEGTGRRADAIPHYEEAIKLDPNLAIAKNNLAYLMADEGKNLDRALDLAQEAKSQLPESGNVADTLGWVLLKKGIPEAAIGYLQESESGFQAGRRRSRRRPRPSRDGLRGEQAAREGARGAASARSRRSTSSARRRATGRRKPAPIRPGPRGAKSMLERLSAAAPRRRRLRPPPAEG